MFVSRTIGRQRGSAPHGIGAGKRCTVSGLRGKDNRAASDQDLNGTTVCQAPAAVISKRPADVRQREISAREWTISFADGDITIGGLAAVSPDAEANTNRRIDG